MKMKIEQNRNIEKKNESDCGDGSQKNNDSAHREEAMSN